MFNIVKLNPISKVADPILNGCTYTDVNPDAALVRSFVMHEWAVPASLLAVARAGAGVNNIPCDDYAKKGICVFNTPGANANAVKELIVAAALIASRNISAAINWASTLTGDDVAKQVEKGKGQFAGTEIMGKTVTILGLGAIGRKAAVAFNALGLNVVGYDPYLSDALKAELSFVTIMNDLNAAIAGGDIITINMPYSKDTKNIINENNLKLMKNGAILINCARGELVDTAAVKVALESNLRCYVTDFPDGDCINQKGIIAIPHLGASTEEAEDVCAEMAAKQTLDYLANGNIVNSVNMPNLSVAVTKKHRVSVISTVAIAGGVSATKNGITYTLIDSDDDISADKYASMEGVIKARKVF